MAVRLFTFFRVTIGWPEELLLESDDELKSEETLLLESDDELLESEEALLLESDDELLRSVEEPPESEDAAESDELLESAEETPESEDTPWSEELLESREELSLEPGEVSSAGLANGLRARARFLDVAIG